MTIGEAIGRGVGALVAPLAYRGSRLRHARLFHPDGVVYRAEVRPLASSGPLGALAARLEGPALVRLSGALWRWRPGVEPWDVLGVAVRFHASGPITPELRSGDQDLLFASFRSVWQLPIAPLTTRVHDFLANDYYAVLPFETAGVGRTRYRLVPARVEATGGDRLERLAHAVEAGVAVLRLECRAPGGPWQGVATIELREAVSVDQSQLELAPSHAGRGIVPVGLWQSVRAVAYPASQRGRTPAPRG